MTTNTVQTNYDPLDLNSYSLNRLPKKKLTKTGAFFKKWGLPIAGILFFVTAVQNNLLFDFGLNIYS